MKKALFSTLRARMIALMLLGILPPILVAIGFASYQAARIIRAEAKENLRLRVESLADSVERWDYMNVQALRGIGEDPAFASMKPSRQLSALSTLYRVYPEIYGVASINTQGDTHASARFLDKPTNYANRDWFRGAMEGRPVTRQTVISRRYHKPAVAFAMPIYRAPTFGADQDGEPIKRLQDALKEKGFWPRQQPISGRHDADSREAVRAFQASQPGLTPSGDFDPLTRYLLLAEKSPNTRDIGPLENASAQNTEHREIVGVISMGSFLTHVGHIVGTTRLGETGYAFLVDKKGRVLAHPEKVFVTGQDLTDFSAHPAVRELMNGREGLFSFTDNSGIRWLSHGVRLNNDWGVLALQQEREVLAREHWFWQLAIIVAAAAALVVILLTWLLARNLTRPVVKLTEAATTLAEGDWQQQVSIQRGDELGVLADTFNQMARQLRVSFSVLEARHEEALRAREEAIQANKAKSVFVANMTHELRTPLNAIIGYSEMLQDDVQDAGHTEYIPDLQKIGIAGKHLLSLVNDVLDFSKVEAGRMELYLETFDVYTMVEDIRKTLQLMFARNNNTLTLHCPPDIGGMFADLTKTRQCLFNLMSNANKFTENGEIRLTVRRYQQKGETWVDMEVRDTGIGMTPAQMNKLFQAFTQADPSTTRKYGGTGLGLVISKQFCQMMGGDIVVSSEFGKGSAFTISLPTQVKAPSGNTEN